MKKMIIMTLAVLGMVLGSIAVVQPVKASSDVECEMFVDPWGCEVWVCSDVLNWHCEGQDSGKGYGSWPMQ